MLNPLFYKSSFEQDGFLVLPFLDQEKYRIVQKYVLKWLKQILGRERFFNPFSYHALCIEKEFHDRAFSARRRHRNPEGEIRNFLVEDNKNFGAIVDLIFKRKCLIWDEGLGFLGIRLIRPAPFDDGYGLSKKVWGPGGYLYSLYLPVFCYGDEDNLGIVPGSHKMHFEPVISEDKFCKSERRLSGDDRNKVVICRPSIPPGNVLLYHPELLHCEAVSPESKKTRVSLEFRFSL